MKITQIIPKPIKYFHQIVLKTRAVSKIVTVSRKLITQNKTTFPIDL